MSAISTITTITKKYFLPIEIENIIYEYLTIEDYNKPQGEFKKIYFKRLSCNRPTLTFFSAVLATNMKSTIMIYIINSTRTYLENYDDTNFYSIYSYEEEIIDTETDQIIPQGYYPNEVNVLDEDEYFMGDNIIHPPGYENIYGLVVNYYKAIN